MGGGCNIRVIYWKKVLVLSELKIGRYKPWHPLSSYGSVLYLQVENCTGAFCFLEIRCDFNNQLVLNYNGVITHPIRITFHPFSNSFSILMRNSRVYCILYTSAVQSLHKLWTQTCGDFELWFTMSKFRKISLLIYDRIC